jgi:hypothetical protein
MTNARKRALRMTVAGLAAALLAAALVRLQVVIGLGVSGAKPFTVLIAGATITGWVFFWAGLIRLVTGRDENRPFGLLWLIVIAILCLPCAFVTMTLATRGTKLAQ